VKKVERLVDNLLQEKKYNDLIEFLEQNINRLNKISERLSCYLRLRDKAKPTDYTFDNLLNWKTDKKYYQKIKNIFLIPMRVLPCYSKSSLEASAVIKKVTLNERFIDYIVKSHSYIFLHFFNLKANDCVDLILRKLLADNRSVLFIELENSQNLNHYCNYSIPESNKMIYYLFHDPKNSQQLSVWRPVGEYVIEKLEYLERHPELDDYNTNIQNFHETSRWDSDIFIAIHFFNLMVSRALYGNIQWHMWLYYYRYFIIGILKNHKTTDIYYNPNEEFPTKYEYLIYEIFSNMADWLKSLDEIDLSQANVRYARNIQEIRLGDRPISADNGNIPISTMVTIGQCLKLLHDSDSISDHFKRYIFSIIFDLYFFLRKNSLLEDYSILLAKAICNNIEYINNNDISYAGYFEFMEEYFKKNYDKAPISQDLLIEFEQIIIRRAHFT
jgi:hypothetical protein